MLTSFADHFPMTSMLKIKEASLARRNTADRSPEQEKAINHYFEVIDQALTAPLVAFLKERHVLGLFEPVSNGTGYVTRFTKCWNTLATRNEQYHQDAAACWEALGEQLARTCLTLAREVAPWTTRPEDTDEKLYTNFVKLVDSGNIEWFMTELRSDCSKSGLSCAVQFNNWVPELWSFDEKQREFVKAPAREGGPNKFLHETVVFPTGELLIADWLRIDAFTKQSKSTDLPDLNSEAGVEARIRDYAQRMNFVSVFVGNTCPRIFHDGARLIVGRDAEDAEPGVFTDVGSVCTDLWWATIIDKATLIAHVAKEHGDAATQLVNDYLESEGVDAVVRVPPGTYHLYFDNNQQTFPETFAAEGVDLTGIEEPFFMLSNTELVMQDKQAMSAGPGLEC